MFNKSDLAIDPPNTTTFLVQVVDLNWATDVVAREFSHI